MIALAYSFLTILVSRILNIVLLSPISLHI